MVDGADCGDKFRIVTVESWQRIQYARTAMLNIGNMK